MTCKRQQGRQGQQGLQEDMGVAAVHESLAIPLVAAIPEVPAVPVVAAVGAVVTNYTMIKQPTNNKPPAVVLLSGGLDSTTTLAIALSDGYEAFALTFRYGQRHDVEIQAAQRIAASLKVTEHVIASIDLRMFGGSALTGEIDVPKGRDLEEMGHGIPVTYVPARNTIFLSFALAWAEVLGAKDIFIGVNALDYSGYPDCRPEYIEAYERMANLATRAGVEDDEGNEPKRLRIHTPLIALTKADIIRRGIELGVDYSLTSTCYDPSPAGLACGTCDACQLRLKGFAESALKDPAPYQATQGT